MDAVKKSRPPATKGTYIRRVTLTTTMGPGIKVDPNQAQAMDEEA
jgi:large subunit ribosomal protein L1